MCHPEKKHHHPKRALGHQYILITVQRTLDCTTYHARSLIQRTIFCSNFSLDTTVYYIPPTTTILELAPHSLMIKHHKSASSDGLSTNVLIDPWGSIFLGVISSRREESQESTSSPFCSIYTPITSLTVIAFFLYSYDGLSLDFPGFPCPASSTVSSTTSKEYINV